MPRPPKTLAALLLAASALLTAGAPAHAGLVSGELDPAFGAAFPNLFWRATFELYVPDACATAVGTGSLDASNFATTSDCNNSRFQNVQLFFYNVADTVNPVESFALGVYSATSNLASGNATEDQSLTGVDLAAGVVTGFDGSTSLRTQAFSAEAGGGANYFSLTISSDPNKAKLYYYDSATQSSPAVATSTVNPVVTFYTVPEPGSLALAGIALAAAAALRRRRARSG